MSGIAEVLLNLGYTISGSDLKLSPTTDRLAALGQFLELDDLAIEILNRFFEIEVIVHA